MTGPALTTRDLTVDHGGQIALQQLDLNVPCGSTLAVIGPNGSGKSTLLRALVRLDDHAGTVDLHGHSVALVLQATDVERGVPITVRDTVAMARYTATGLLRRFRADDKVAVTRSMARLHIEDLADRQLHELSGGQRQRVLVAQGLAQEADILLLDEPMTGLDVVSRDRILTAIEEERTAGRAVVMTTHNLEDARLCDQVLLLATRAVALGPPSDVLVEDHLREAFGGRVLATGGDVVLDDPHHAH